MPAPLSRLDTSSALLDTPAQRALRTRSPHSATALPRNMLYRTASSASLAGDSAFVATSLPPLPLLENRSRPPSPVKAASTKPLSRPPRPNRRRRQVAPLALALVALLVWSRFSPPIIDFLYLTRFKLRDHAHNAQWTYLLLFPFGLRASPCSLRKQPLLFVRGERQVAVVWETNGCPSSTGKQWRARWVKGAGERRAGTAMPGLALAGRWKDAVVKTETVVEETDELGGRIVYTALLDGLEGGEMYQYELVLVDNASHRTSTLIRHSFPWVGGYTSSQPTAVHIACLADNQYNLRVFRRALLRLSSLYSSLSSSTYFHPSFLPRSFTPPASSPHKRPHLLLHAGDAVQNPHDLAQWQTDLWDPLTRGGAGVMAGQSTPMVLARGNHDWDSTGRNVYSGGVSGANLRAEWEEHLARDGMEEGISLANSERGIYHSFSPHQRMRFLVLDSNLPTEAEQAAQERWVEWEVERREWREASLRVVVVHTAPWIEWWDRTAWTKGGESEWSSYVRRCLIPLVARSGASLILSGHSHAYTRGFLPLSLVPSFAAAPNSSAVPALARAAALERSWERSTSVRERGVVEDEGVVLITFGGAGGTLDEDRVEDWGFMSRSVSGVHHAGWMAVSFGDTAASKEVDRAMQRRGKKKAPTVFRPNPPRRCRGMEELVRDVIEWRSVSVYDGGKELDRVFIVAESCTSL
ncbi:hypothetical protein NBRC10513_001050 [Rhodotorula toruloides]|uniref:BY PROTMAP: gi/472584083/gb/EMS21689.1/ Metallo-dependent phosphatase [Rhodosporidium toruloides NP11] gi/647394594/emb/CDR35825.1/ RHTO0S01e07910g1_1 [Rhodosporidium toruloides] n=1 Tax=Rhodotorula toruloides TaxID=5286 RepID=A0A0K3CK55_RHOTO|nr:Metallo-dependent phosphatase-like protein [Rhodotorula toruloides]